MMVTKPSEGELVSLGAWICPWRGSDEGWCAWHAQWVLSSSCCVHSCLADVSAWSDAGLTLGRGADSYRKDGHKIETEVGACASLCLQTPHVILLQASTCLSCSGPKASSLPPSFSSFNLVHTNVWEVLARSCCAWSVHSLLP